MGKMAIDSSCKGDLSIKVVSESVARRKYVVEGPVNSNIDGEGAEVLKAVFQGFRFYFLSFYYLGQVPSASLCVHFLASKFWLITLSFF